MFFNTKYFAFGFGKQNLTFSKRYQKLCSNVRVFRLLGGRVYLRVGAW